MEATNKMLQEQLIITKTELENVTKCSVDSKQTTEAMEELQAMISDLRFELKSKKNQISLLESQNAKLCQDINCLQIRLSEKNEMIMKMDEKFHSMSNNYCVNLEKFNHVNREIHAEKPKEDYPNIKDVFRQSEKPPERAGNMKVQPSLDSSSEENVVYERATYTDTKKDQKDVSEVKKKTIFVIGNSHMNKLDPERLSRSYNVEKVVAYTIKEAKEAIQKISKDPDCVVFHLITNDVKNCDADECMKRMNILLLDAYNLQCKMWQLGNNKCWLARVNKVLNKFDQMVDSNMFHCVNTKKFKITLQSDYISQWKSFINGNEKIVTGNKLRTYCLFKSNYIYEPYLDEIRSHSIKKELVKFRISATKLAIESGRYLRPQVPLNDRLCTFCNDKCVENEMHFLLDCEFYKEKRESLYRIASQHCELFTFMDKIDKFIYLVSCEGPLIIEVAKFCKDAMNMRLQ